MYGRIDVLRILLKEEGIYDAGTDDFSKEIYEKMIINKNIMENSGVKQLLKTVKETEDLIWFMNNIAGMPVISVNQEIQV